MVGNSEIIRVFPVGEKIPISPKLLPLEKIGLNALLPCYGARLKESFTHPSAAPIGVGLLCNRWGQ
jgi:hypothetical protein